MRVVNVFAAVASTIATLVVAAPVLAAVPVPFGWYLEGNVGTSRTSNVTYVSGTSADSSGWAWNLNAGFKFIPFFAAEIGYTNPADTDEKFNKTTVAQVSQYVLDVAAKAILPFADSGFEVFGKLGAAWLHSQVHIKNVPYVNANGLSVSNSSQSATGLYFGIGGEYAFMPNLLGNIQWNRANGDSNTGNVELYSVGLNYLFG